MNAQLDAGVAPMPSMTGLLTRINAPLAKAGMILAITGLLTLVIVVFYQVFGRYVLNDSPSWTENLAIVLILYVTMIGAAVGVRDAGHIALDSLTVLLPAKAQRFMELIIYVAICIFGAAMAYNGWVLGWSVHAYLMPNLHVTEAVRYIPLAVSGVLIIMFSIEHILAIFRGAEVVPSWH